MMGYDADPDDSSEYGTGHVFGTFLGLKIEDDGATDADVKVTLDDGYTTLQPLRHIRSELGDEMFEQFLEDLTLEGHESVDSSDFEMREPVAFKCSGCLETWPRTRNDGSGVCPKCRGDGR